MPSSSPEASDATVRDPFAVIPVKPDNVDQRQDSQGMVHLRMRIEPEGFSALVAKWLRYDYARKIELDAFGSYYYKQVDGETTLDIIVDRMAKKLGTGRGEAEQAVVLFTKKLMTMNMLSLKVPSTPRTGE